MSAYPDDKLEEHFSDLTFFASIVALCEHSLTYTGRSHGAVEKIIRICQAEQQMQLRAYDRAVAKQARHD